MSIGYACQTVGVLNTKQKSCMLKNISQAKLMDLITYNLSSLENIIDYNIKNNIRLFRISSDLIPFGSSFSTNLLWGDLFASRFLEIGKKIQESGIRVSMHPGQYTVLNSPNREVVTKAIDDLRYHNKVLDNLGIGSEHKIVLHIGGIYNDKKQAMKRFIMHYHQLPKGVKQRLVLENDDKLYTINDVLEIATHLDIPVIFDNLHHKINCFDQRKNEYDWLDECGKTWKKKDGNQKIHYAQQNPLKRPGAHSNSIAIKEFICFYENIANKAIDIMLEVKDKNLSAIKCINATSSGQTIKALEVEWGKYKYKVLESSPSDYVEIRKLLQNKKDYPVIAFYNLLETALEKENTMGNTINAALHIWSYFKNTASEEEKNKFLKRIDLYKQGKISLKTVKNNLFKMAMQYNQSYLLDSYYFIT